MAFEHDDRGLAAADRGPFATALKLALVALDHYSQQLRANAGSPPLDDVIREAMEYEAALITLTSKLNEVEGDFRAPVMLGPVDHPLSPLTSVEVVDGGSLVCIRSNIDHGLNSGYKAILPLGEVQVSASRMNPDATLDAFTFVAPTAQAAKCLIAALMLSGFTVTARGQGGIEEFSPTPGALDPDKVEMETLLRRLVFDGKCYCSKQVAGWRPCVHCCASALVHDIDHNASPSPDIL